ncbi:hypothetical protein BC937DRAFT_94776 [Endogone sp. FLAS-F59071]|nr:hypothetical protein BC937DRAFT_94776 [Endogone sp. FLAS-F59071]|eukprot:RUS13791.1 hypothetical protein BC937DRAFT_94776 [Endogone sp. FLAS-F59071]
MPGTMAAAIKTDENPLPQPLSPSITISSGPHTITAAAAMVMKTTHKPPQPAPALPTKLSFSPFSDMSDLSDMSDASTSSDDDDNSAIISDGALSGDDADEQLDAANNPNSAVGPSKASTPIKITRTSSRSTRSPVQSPAEDLPHSKPSVSPSLRGRGAGKSRRGGRGRAKAKATNEYQRKRKKEVKGTAEPVPALTHIEEALTRPEAYRADPDGVYCVCRSGYDGSEFMVLCDICLGWRLFSFLVHLHTCLKIASIQ